MTATAADERSPLLGPTWPPSALTTSFPLTERRRVVLADDPCGAGFSGADPEYAGIYLHARYFDPKLGVFVSPDPIGVEGGLNQYAYGFGDPVNGADRSGLLKDQCEGDQPCIELRYQEHSGGLRFIYGGGGGVSPLILIPAIDFLFGGPNKWPGVPSGPVPSPVTLPPPTPIEINITVITPPPGPAPGGGDGGTRRSGSVGVPGTFEYMIPFWGSGRAAIDNFQNDEWAEGCFNTAMVVSDVCLVKSLVTGLAKGGMKYTGSHTWSATRSWYGRSRKLPPRTPVHHWLIEQRSATGRALSLAIVNQPYNFLPTANQAFHNAVHGFGPWSLGRVSYGTPGWAKAAWISSAGHGLDRTSELMDSY